ncbi:MAG: PQQ-binding-like beta-propeller repeat protein [Planctomycetota bacterium]
MSHESLPSLAEPPQNLPVTAADVPRGRGAYIILGVYWLAFVAARLLEMPYFFRFLFGMAAPALLLIVFSVWWWMNRTISWKERVLGFALVVGGAFAAAPLTHPSMGLPQTLMVGLPVVITVWIAWVLWRQHRGLGLSLWPSVVVVLLTWSTMGLVRMEGLDGDLKAQLRWRWSPTAEELFLADQRSAEGHDEPVAVTAPLELSPGDWPEFRGPQRDGVVPATAIATDWNEQPPQLVWKQRVGPAWSSMIVVGDRIYTQEQHGEQEAVVCYAAATGRQLWAHDDEARFWEAVSGAGPRGTPTFADGRLYTLGATGILNCLNATTGRRQWSHNLQTDAAATVPLWGLSSSPLVVGKIVVVYGGGENQNNLLAYDAQSGAAVWTTAAGACSYSSPQLTTLDGQPQILMLSDQGLTSVEPAKGRVLWTTGLAMPGVPRSLQAHVLEGQQLLGGSLAGMGVSLFDVARAKGIWTTKERWTSSQTKPEFSDLVVYQNHAYGFDGAIFCSIDLATGKRAWKGGRYGRGQVVLLKDQATLLVLSESGEAVLVAARSDKHEELGKFEAIAGKTWNHPIVVHGRLYVRNAEEMACYQLTQRKE